jgi:hypothetical protein
MDSLIAAAARALAAGNALAALQHVALRDDPPSLALRGIAMAQLGEHTKARQLLRRAARGFGSHEALAQARCVVAETEVALALRDFGGSPRTLLAAAATLEARGDRANARQARLIAVRQQVLLGRLDEARTGLATLDLQGAPPALTAVAELIAAELALRALDTHAARVALAQAQDAAARSGVPALQAEVAEARTVLERPAARRIDAGADQNLRLDEVAALLASGALVVDGCRRGLQCGERWVSLARRPVLFGLLRVLAEYWPQDTDRDTLIARVFRTHLPDETHRARLRVEMGRLRALVRELARIEATPRGFALRPRDGAEVAVLAPPIDGEQASLLALLADGAAWSTSALALATGASQRTVQRALAELEAEGRVRSAGRARARRWLAPSLAPHLADITTILLLPATLPAG